MKQLLSIIAVFFINSVCAQLKVFKDTFTFDQVGVKFEFNTKEQSMTLFQGGAQIEFSLVK